MFKGKVWLSQLLWIQILVWRRSTTGNKVCRKYYCKLSSLSRRVDINEHVWTNRKPSPLWSKLQPRHPQLQRPRARPTSSDASQLSHWCSPNPFPNERLARPSLSRPIGWLHRVVWTNGEGVELQTEWKWPRETEGDTERETEIEGGISLAYAAPTHLTSP